MTVENDLFITAMVLHKFMIDLGNYISSDDDLRFFLFNENRIVLFHGIFCRVFIVHTNTFWQFVHYFNSPISKEKRWVTVIFLRWNCLLWMKKCVSWKRRSFMLPNSLHNFFRMYFLENIALDFIEVLVVRWITFLQYNVIHF